MRSRSRNEDGQIFPLVLLAAVGLLALGFALFQVGRGTDLKARAQTGADAAALAGAEALREDLLGVLTAALTPVPVPPVRVVPSGPAGPPVPVTRPLPPVPPAQDLTQLPASVIEAAAASYATKNDTDLLTVQFDLATLIVRVQVQTKGALTGIGGGAHGTAAAKAQIVLGGGCLPAPATGVSLPLPACPPGHPPVLGDLSAHVRLVG